MINFLRLLFIFAGILCISSQLSFSQYAIPAADMKAYPVPGVYMGDTEPELPVNVENHHSLYFPFVNYIQGGLPSCGQASGIAHCLTYEFNRARNVFVDSVNYMAPLYPFSFLNEGYGWYGVNTMETWEFIKSQGCASLLDYGDPNSDVYMEAGYTTTWMNGYDKYYRAMHNRIADYYSLDVSDGEGLRLLKHYLANHLDESEAGGTAIFYSGTLFLMGEYSLGVYKDPYLCCPFDSISVNSELGPGSAHSMTVVGYITNTQLDFNGDGYISDSLDINDDGIVDFHDNEKTLWIIVNSYYHMYYFSFLKYDGISKVWDSKVFFPVPEKDYSPQLTFKVKMRHPQRNALRIRAGFSEDTESEMPEKMLELPIFNFQSGRLPLSGLQDSLDADLLEFGIDITDGLKLFGKNGDVSVFLCVDNAASSDAEIIEASLVSYTGDGADEYLIAKNVELPGSSYQAFSVIAPLDGEGSDEPLSVVDNELIIDDFKPEHRFTLTATGGEPPYQYTLLNQNEYVQITDSAEFPGIDPLGWVADTMRVVPFEHGFPFAGKVYDSVSIGGDLCLHFEDSVELSLTRDYPYPYVSYGMYAPLEIYPLNGFEFKDVGRVKTVSTDSSLLVGLRYNRNHIASVELFPDGRIRITYSLHTYDYGFRGIAGVNTYSENYYSELPDYAGVGYKYNRVTYVPVLQDSVISLSGDGVLTVKPDQYFRDTTVYVVVEDGAGERLFKRVELKVVNKEPESLVLYPNPVTDETYLNFSVPESREVVLQIYSVDGELFFSKNYTMEPGQNRLRINPQALGLPPGVYMLLISGGVKCRSSKMIVL